MKSQIFAKIFVVICLILVFQVSMGKANSYSPRHSPQSKPVVEDYYGRSIRYGCWKTACYAYCGRSWTAGEWCYTSDWFRCRNDSDCKNYAFKPCITGICTIGPGWLPF